MRLIHNTKVLSQLFLFAVAIMLMASGCKKDPPVVVDPEKPKIRINSLIRDEGDVDGTFAVTIQANKAWDVEYPISFATEDQSALAGEDFEATTGSVTMPAGSTQVTISVVVVGDTLLEPDETFAVTITGAPAADVIGTTAIVTLRNDDTYRPLPQDGYDTPRSYAGYKLAWEDEFDGNALSSDWTFETGNSGWGNNELQNYTNGDNAWVTGGKLFIEARKESSNGSDYSSSRIVTMGKKEFKYGRIDIRAALPEGRGIWPALWMLGSNFPTVGWPSCGEIDIMELIGHEPNVVHGTAHWELNGARAQYGQSYTIPSGKFSDAFHVFSIVWDQNRIVWMVNDVPYNTLDITPSTLSEFHNPFFFIFNIAVGGNWPGSPDASTVFPQQMIVDYIRVFEKI